MQVVQRQRQLRQVELDVLLGEHDLQHDEGRGVRRGASSADGVK